VAKFLLEYDYDGALWAFTIDADTWDDAEARLAAMTSARILGMVGESIPVEQYVVAGRHSNNALPAGVRPRPKLTVVPPLSYQKD
jgi:hypothetical protein